MAGEKSLYKNGYWEWNELINGLNFVNYERELSPRKISGLSKPSKILSSSPDVAFEDTIGKVAEMKFRKYYRRKVKSNQPDVVKLQDIKDIALFTCNVTHLTVEFVKYFHTKAMDTFLRSAIIYFQYYLQVWHNLQQRRGEIKRKLRQPKIVISENVIRDDLADLRSMLARDYGALLTGLGDALKFHHMNNDNNVSLSDKDRRLNEMLVVMTGRVIWIALQRKCFILIEKEMNRLLRSDRFSAANYTSTDVLNDLPGENQIIHGTGCKREQKLFQRSPLVQEIILQDHNFQMLAIGVADMGNADARQEYLEIAYTAPEELLESLNVGVGILGTPRKYFTSMLKLKELSTTKKQDSIMKPIPEFCIPPRQTRNLKVRPNPQKTVCKYGECQNLRLRRNAQCKLWILHIHTRGNLKPILLNQTETT